MLANLKIFRLDFSDITADGGRVEQIQLPTDIEKIEWVHLMLRTYVANVNPFLVGFWIMAHNFCSF